MQRTQIDRVGRTVIGVLGICISGGEVGLGLHTWFTGCLAAEVLRMVSSEWWHVGKVAFIFAAIVITMDGIPVYVVNTVAYAAGCGAIGRWARGFWSCEATASVVVVTEEESEPNSS